MDRGAEQMSVASPMVRSRHPQGGARSKNVGACESAAFPGHQHRLELNRWHEARHQVDAELVRWMRIFDAPAVADEAAKALTR
jgi:hypothetical protein